MFIREAQRKSKHAARIDSPQPILNWVAEFVGLAPTIFTDPKRSREKALAKALATWLATSSGVASVSEMARWLRCAKSGLHKLVESYPKARPDWFNEDTPLPICRIPCRQLRRTERMRSPSPTLPPSATDHQPCTCDTVGDSN